MLMQYIWQYKTLRVHQKVRLSGSSDLQSWICTVSRSCGLSKLVNRYSKDYEADWKIVEDAGFSPRSFGELLWMSASIRPNCKKYNAYLKATLQVWDRRVLSLTSPTARVRTFLGQCWFPPGKPRLRFTACRNTGILLL